MRLKSLEFKGLCSYYEKTRINFENLGHVVLILGMVNGSKNKSIGAGKTSIFKILTWILFNDFIEEINKKDFLSYGEKRGYGAVTFNDNGKIITIKRCIGSSNKLTVKVGKKNKTKRTPTMTQDWINRYLGIDFTIWRNSVLTGQGDKRKILEGTDKERKDIFGKIAGFDELDHLLSNLRMKKGALNSRIDSVGSKLDVYEEIGMETVADENTIRLIDEQIKINKKKIISLEKILGSAKEKEKEVRDSDEVLSKKMSKVSKILYNLHSFRNLTRKEMDKKIVKRNSLILKGKGLFKLKNCPTCYSKLSKGKIRDIIKNERDDTNKEIKVLEKKIDKYMEESDKHILKENSFQRKRNKLDIEEKSNATDDILERISKAKHEIEKFAIRKDNILKSIKIAKETEEKKQSLKSELKVLNKKSRSISDMEDILGLYGYRVARLAEILPEVEDRTNEYLGEVSDDDFQIHFKDFKKTQLEVHHGNRISTWNAYSGGEKNLIATVMYIVMGELMTEQSATFDFMLRDEIFKELDISHISKIMDLLQEIGRKKDLQIFIITNQRSVVEYFKPEDYILAKKDDGKSRIEVSK